MNRKLSLILASAAIVLSMIACSFGSTPATSTVEAPTTVPPVDVPSDALEILSTSLTADSYGSYYLFGEVANNSDTAITGIELTVSVTDASGASVLVDGNGNVTDSVSVYPMLYTIAAGESSPFSYYIGTTNSTPAADTVTVANYSAGYADRADMTYDHVEIVDDGYGNYYLTGELINQSSQWIHINGLAGGVLDDANTVLSADWTGTYSADLAPTGDSGEMDRTPFAVSFPMPTQEATQWSIWWDADVKTDVPAYDLGVNVTNSYFDEYGDVHLVGVVENYSNVTLTSLLVAGLYDADGAVLDAGYNFISVPMASGGSTPFDITYFGNVNYNDTQAARIDSYTVQYDPWNTYEPYSETVEVGSSGESIDKSGASWYVTGTFNNTSDKNLSNATVLVMVYDGADNLVAFGSVYLYPDSDTYAPGASDTYELTLYLSPTADTGSYRTVTTVIGDIAE